MPIVGASISLLCILIMFGLPWVGSTWASFWIQKPIKSKSFKNIQNEKQCSIILSDLITASWGYRRVTL